MSQVIPIILILGPTAGGKTQVAIEIARRIAAPGGPPGGECISADSMQVYRGMDIGTAKPTADEQAAAPHHLIEIADPADDDFNVDRWLELAERCIEQVRRRGRYPIVVGGTNLYVQMLLAGMCAGPEPDLELRGKLRNLGLDALRERLEQADPAASQRIHRHDRKRSIRAIEVYEQTGRRLSELQTQWRGAIRDDVIIVGLEYPVPSINSRINSRVKEMFERGFVDEVRRLKDAGRLGRQAREALGYKQVLEHLEGRISLTDAIEQVKIRTRRFAKQQRTWLRRFRVYKRSIWLDAANLTIEQITDSTLTFIAECEGEPHCEAENAVSSPETPT